jgi:hypothetical protein
MEISNRVKSFFKEVRGMSSCDDDEKWEGKSCGAMVSANYRKGEDITCQDVIDDIYRPFATSDLKYYPHHGLYQRRLSNGAISNKKGDAPTVPCGMHDTPPEGLHVEEYEYEVIKNIMYHKTFLSNGKLYEIRVTFPKMTDSYLFGGIIKASNLAISNALKGICADIDCN